MRNFTWLAGLMVCFACGGESVTIIGDAGSDATAKDTGVPPPIDAMPPPDTGLPPDAGVDAPGPFNVKSVPGLALWLDAAQSVTLNGSKVAGWNDLSGNNNHASQTTDAYRPTMSTAQINGLPAVHFTYTPYTYSTDGGYTQPGWNYVQVTDSASLQWGTGDFAIFTVARYNSTSGGYYGMVSPFYSKLNANSNVGVELWGNVDTGYSSTNGLGLHLGSNLIVSNSTAYNDAAARIFAGRRYGTTAEIRVNGAAVSWQALGTASDVSAIWEPVRIGTGASTYAYDNARMNGDVAELICVKGSISASDLAGIETYLKNKYAL